MPRHGTRPSTALAVVPDWAATHTFPASAADEVRPGFFWEPFALAGGIVVGLGLRATLPELVSEVVTLLVVALFMLTAIWPGRRDTRVSAAFLGWWIGAWFTPFGGLWTYPWWVTLVAVVVSLALLALARRVATTDARRLASLTQAQVRVDAVVTSTRSWPDRSMTVTAHDDASRSWTVDRPAPRTGYRPRYGEPVGVWHHPDDPVVAVVAAPRTPPERAAAP